MRIVFSFLLVFVLLSHHVARGEIVRFDFNAAGSPTQPGWISAVSGNGSNGTVSVSTVSVGAGVSVDTRNRGSENGGGAEAAMWNDFVFANGSNIAGEGLDVSLSGLAPNSSYPITIWGFDDVTNGGTTGDWNGNSLTFYNSPDPSSLGQYQVSFNITTDASGSATIQGRVGSPKNNGHNVFINGLEIGQKISIHGPTDISLSNTILSKTTAIGTTVGTLSTSDPTPNDTFTYTLVGGAGSAHNALFTISGNSLQTDRDLSTEVGALSIRIRTTDADGDSFEKVFLIFLISDSDNDGLDDAWELSYFPNLTTASGSGNNDGDTLTNLQEQSLGTNPTLSDTDADGLNDDKENGSGNYIDANQTGSDPLLADTDGDGLSDGAEVSSANGYVTDPNLTDTDGDQYSDALELSEGTSPIDGNDKPTGALAIRITEILADNETGLRDGDGKREDWIELFNPNNQAVNLAGYYLTDDALLLTKWMFPSVNIPAGGYMVVFASGNNTLDAAGNQHTNFKLSKNGEYLAIVRPGGTVIDDQLHPEYPEQFGDVSYGTDPATGVRKFYSSPTPGAANAGVSHVGVVKDTQFSVDRGFYDSSFQLVISTNTPGAEIRYTTDGSLPTASNGILYTGPITVETTTPIRAIAYRSGFLPTNVDAQTYIFPNDVAQQSATPTGWPNTWTTAPADYAMDPRVVNNTLPGYSVRDALLDIPSVSISLPIDDFVGSGQGLYSYPLNRWETQCSVEYIHPDGTPGFQHNCKIETHGNSSRNPSRMQKHSLRLTFSSSVGVPKLKYPLFADSPVETFNKLVLRACFTDSWALYSWSASRYRPNDSQYFRDVWMKESFRDMGQPSSYGNFVHVYVNGLYFGLHNLTERLEDDHYAEHLGGDAEDWEVYADFSNSGSRWNDMMNIANGSIQNQSTYNNIKDYIDLENYIDYMLLHFYADAEDWPSHNGYAAVNNVSGDGKYRFFVWDQEIALDKFSWNRYNASSGGAAPFQRLRLNEEFRMLFADRVQKHLFNQGALSENGSIARYSKIAGWIDRAIVAESARWGDVQDTTPGAQTVSQPSPLTNVDHDAYPEAPHSPNIYFTREDSWLKEFQNVTGHYIPTLHDANDPRSIIRELRSNNLFPSINAPVFSQHGGDVPSGYALSMAADGIVYYTLDGSDPRLEGGAVNTNAGTLVGGTLKTTFVALEENGWRYLDDGSNMGDSQIIVGNAAYNSSHWKHPSFDHSSWGTGQALLGYGTITGGTVNTTISFGSNANNKHITTYLRKPFTVTGASDYTALSIRMRRDDSAILYLNGREIARSNLPAGNITFTDTANGGVSGSNESALFNFTYNLAAGELQEGQNILAVEVHQSVANSSDLGIDIQLEGVKPQSGMTSVAINQSATVKARALVNGEWSALTEADFSIGNSASSSNLVISEIMYNPLGGSSHEYIELTNISDTETIDLSGAAFTLGIEFTFPNGQVLAPGARLLIVEDTVAFETKYGSGLPVIGQYTGRLSDSGEQIILRDNGGTVIRNFFYSDSFPWPEGADGTGYSLVLVSPENNPDHGIATNWRASISIDGTPGSSDNTQFAGNPDEDLDNDQLSRFLEYALGSSDTTHSPEVLPVASIEVHGDGTPAGGLVGNYLTLTFTRNLAADDVLYEVQISNDLDVWRGTSSDIQLVSRTNNGNGTESLKYRSTQPMDGLSREFIRLKVSER